jgi:hypothetical protein
MGDDRKIFSEIRRRIEEERQLTLKTPAVKRLLKNLSQSFFAITESYNVLLEIGGIFRDNPRNNTGCSARGKNGPTMRLVITPLPVS